MKQSHLITPKLIKGKRAGNYIHEYCLVAEVIQKAWLGLSDADTSTALSPDAKYISGNITMNSYTSVRTQHPVETLHTVLSYQRLMSGLTTIFLVSRKIKQHCLFWSLKCYLTI